MQSVPNHKHCEFENCAAKVYLIQHYVIKFVRDLCWFSPVSPANKTNRHDITEILPKVALNTINLKLKPSVKADCNKFE